MSPGLGLDIPRRLTLDPVVADRGGCAKPFLDVARLEDLPLFLRRARPDPRETVGLQFELDRQFIRPPLIQPILQFGHLR